MPNSTVSRPATEPAPAELPRSRQWVLLLVAGALVLAGLGFGAFVLGKSVQTDVGGDLQITGHFKGTVSAVDFNGSAFCVTPPRHEPRCSVPYLQPGSAKLTVGEKVSVATAWLHEGDQTKEVFIVLAR